MRTALLMLVSTICFAIVNTIVKFMGEFSPFQLVFFRSLGSLIICWIQIKRLGISPWGVNKKYLILRGVSGVVALCMFFIVVQKLKLGTAVTLQYLSPIFTALIAVFMLKEKVSAWKWLTLLVCMAGVIVLKVSDLDMTGYYLVLGILTAALSGLAYNCVRKCRETDHPLIAVFYFPLLGVPVAGALSVPEWQWPTGWDWLLIAALGIFTQIAQYTMTIALQGDKAANVTIFKYLGVIYAFGVGYFFFNETLTILGVVGVFVILAGIILFQIPDKKSDVKNA